jgi:hypothetical protein
MRYTMPGNIIVEFDDEDAALVLHHKWHVRYDSNTMYARAHIWVGQKRTTIDMHRLLLQPGPRQTVDHIDLNGLNNHRNNLRLCSQDQNCRNRRVSKNKKSSKYKGVYHVRKVWMAIITSEGLRVYLGRYKSAEEAAHAYNVAAAKLYGDYACLNALPESYDQSNSPIPTTANKSSHFRGVSWNRLANQWVVQFTSNGKNYFGGYYKDEITAAKAYNTLATIYLGNRAKLNSV